MSRSLKFASLENFEPLSMPIFVCSLRGSATLGKLWHGGPGEVVPYRARSVPDGEECRWATIPRLSASHQVRRSEVGCVQAENDS